MVESEEVLAPRGLGPCRDGGRDTSCDCGRESCRDCGRDHGLTSRGLTLRGIGHPRPPCAFLCTFLWLSSMASRRLAMIFCIILALGSPSEADREAAHCGSTLYLYL